jgi:lipid-A-disaccharide synthase-like uncharacterized protein
MHEWFRSPAGWYVLGFAGQLVFGSRFLVQWLASERARRVVIPGTFWVLSAVGGLALFLYAVHVRDPVFAFGQIAGLFIYSRNLVLHRGARPASPPPA